MAQSTWIEGRVIDSSGTGIGEVYVLSKSGSTFALTDGDGRFKIKLPTAESYSLRFRRMGYRTLTKKIEGDSSSIRTKVTLTSEQDLLSPVVVTATRTRRAVEELPAPVETISQKQIQESGNTRLSQVLAEQTGITLVSDHGTGLQMQGLSSEYTRIMINGQPLVGRTAGTLDLSRISVGDVKQVEVMKGPSSALWGSDALAGVVNIITQRAQEPFEMEVYSRYATNNSLDLGANVQWKEDSWRNNLHLNRNSSDGYRLVAESIAPTVPPHKNYTLSYSSQLDITRHLEADLYARFYREEQQSTDYIGSTENPTLLNEEAMQQDYGVRGQLRYHWSPLAQTTLQHYSSFYKTDRTYYYKNQEGIYSQEIFSQRFHKTDLQTSFDWNKRWNTTVGVGGALELLRSDRYAGNPKMQNGFLYAQQEWNPTNQWTVIGGFRYDAHSAYKNQLSPKFSVLYKAFDWLHFRGSAGRGYKAPVFRQLYLNFTNPTAGYSVFGSNTVVERVNELQNQGKIERVLQPLGNLQEIKAEQSWAYNTGVRLYPDIPLTAKINLFWNDVGNLIEAAPVAQKTNGESVYTYFNLNNIYTRGLELNVNWQPISSVDLQGGFQVLEAKKQIENTKTVVGDEGKLVEKHVTKYRPMFNRSRYSGTLKLRYDLPIPQASANIRGTYRGRYGRIDANGNGYVDPEEYEPGYFIWDVSADKTIADRYRLRAGINNVLNFTRPSDLPFLSGRTYYIQLSIEI